MRFFSRRSADASICAQTLVLLLALAVTLQAGHVCPYTQHGGPGVEAQASSAAAFCTVCAISHSLLISVILLLLQLVPIRSRMVFVSAHARSFWHGMRLYVRPPPVFA